MKWELEKWCDCDWCKPRGGKNNHAWAFFHYLRKAGNDPTVETTDSQIIITVGKREMQTHSHITPKYLNPPKQGKKMASVKDDNGDLYWLPPDYLSWLQRGEAADITWNQQQWGQMSARVVTAINGRDITGAAQPGPGDRPAPAANNAPVRTATDSEKSLEMFCMGVVGRVGGAGVIQQPQEIPMWLQAARDAWETIIQGKAPRMVDAPKPGSQYDPSEPPAPSGPEDYGH